MALFNKSDLYYSDYRWTAHPGDDPHVTGEPDSTLFNKHEGYELLYLINKMAEKHGFMQKESGEKIEKMIHDHLPSNIRSQQDVQKWIEDNWKKFDL